MARINKIKEKEQPVVLNWYQREALGVILAAVGIFFSIALLSYNPRDNGFVNYDSDLFFITNWAGQAGAYAADFLIYLFGLAAYGVFASILLLSYLFLFKQFSIKSLITRFLVVPVFIITAAGLCSLYQIDCLHSTPGGQVGFLFEYWLASIAGFHGSVIVAWAALWISIIFMFRISLAHLLVTGIKQIYFFIAAKKVFESIKKIGLACYVLQKKITSYLQGFNRKNMVGSPAKTLPLSDSFMQEEIEQKKIAQDMQNTIIQDQRVSTEKIVNESVKSGIRFLQYPIITLTMARKKRKNAAKRYRQYRILSINSVIAKNIFAVDGAEKSIVEQLQEIIIKEAKVKNNHFVLPDVSLFMAANSVESIATMQEEAYDRGKVLEETLMQFGIKGTVTAVRPGPVITVYEYKPDANNKISKITALEDDLAMALQAMSIRIIAPIPGKDVIGFEVANRHRAGVFFSQVVTSNTFQQATGLLPFIVGVDVVGQPVVEDLATTPHLLVSGTTGSGKSVGLNVLLMSLLCKKKPDQLRLILVDPKRLEFTPYADIPHLLFPIVTHPLKAVQVLKWVVQEMELRYERMALRGVRNIIEYQALLEKRLVDDEGKAYEPMPFIVVMIDELADLMMVAGKEVETSIIRIAQMARAAGIHLILATQRPSVDVVTGIIKVNFPSRMAFRVSSKVDSRTILDQQGAEKLLGKGDLLFMHASSSFLVRVHGPYVSDKEIAALTQHLKAQQQVEYLDLNDALNVQHVSDLVEDELYSEVLRFVKTIDEISISSLQRQYRIGFNRSARLIEKLEMDGLIAPAQGSKPRRVLR